MNLARPIAQLVTTTGCLIIVVNGLPAIAQSTEPLPPPPDSTTAIDLTIPPWASVGHSSSGGGFDGITFFEGFLPVDQHPGQTITFLSPRFLVDNDGQVGGTLLLGHRIYDERGDRIFGGYIALDHRQTGTTDFTQLGLGLERLGRRWEMRINTYIPLGDTRQTVDEDRTTGSLQVATQFQRNQLLLSSRQEEQITRVVETALFGLDAEVGATLATWRNGGALRAFGGGYLYDGESIENTLGWRLRLEGRPNQNVTLGLALQDDDRFGTNLVASVGVTLPRQRPTGPIDIPQAVQARLGEAVVRQPTIIVDMDTETEQRVEERTEPLQNPEEEEPYRFIHVTLGARGGNGTFERPFGTVQQALDAAVSDGNTIVYVDAGSNATIPALTIPDRVRVLSQAPRQLLAGLPFPGFPEAAARLPFSPIVNYNDGILVRLPLSGDGRFPTIRDTAAQDLVTMGDRTVLSGFLIQDAPRHAVAATTTVDAEIRDNTITNAGGSGIALTDVTGSVVLFDNRISGSRGTGETGQGILVRNSLDSAVGVTIERHQLQNNRIGIEVAAVGDITQGFDPQQIVTIDQTTVQDSREQGLLFAAERLGNQQIRFEDGTIQTSGAEGVYARATNRGSQEITVATSTIQGNRGDGIRGQAGLEDGTSTAAQEIFVRSNRIESNGRNGIAIESNEAAAQEFTIDRNTIQANAGDGIRGVSNNTSFQEYVTDPDNNSLGISNNAIANNGGQGINLDANDSSTLVLDLNRNSLTGNQATTSDLEITANAITNNVCVVANQNVSARGIRLDNNSTGLPALFQVGSLTALSVRNSGTVVLQPSPSAFVDRPGIESCFSN